MLHSDVLDEFSSSTIMSSTFTPALDMTCRTPCKAGNKTSRHFVVMDFGRG